MVGAGVETAPELGDGSAFEEAGWTAASGAAMSGPGALQPDMNANVVAAKAKCSTSFFGVTNGPLH